MSGRKASIVKIFFILVCLALSANTIFSLAGLAASVLDNKKMTVAIY
jgi:hypothetical protein